MKTLGSLLILIGLCVALYGAWGVPASYAEPSGAPQAAQVSSEAARIAAGGIAVMLIGIAAWLEGALKDMVKRINAAVERITGE